MLEVSIQATVIKLVDELGLDPEITIGVPLNGRRPNPGDVVTVTWAIRGPDDTEKPTKGKGGASRGL